MLTREEALKLAQELVDYRATSLVEGGKQLAYWVLREEEDRKALVDNLAAVQSRCMELLEQRRCLAWAIEEIVKAAEDVYFDASETRAVRKAIDDALLAARGAQ